MADPIEDFALDEVPTVARAKQVFTIRPDLAQVLTDQGVINRDGTFVPT